MRDPGADTNNAVPERREMEGFSLLVTGLSVFSEALKKGKAPTPAIRRSVAKTQGNQRGELLTTAGQGGGVRASRCVR